MTGPSESQTEPGTERELVLSPKTGMKIGFWNVRTLLETSKLTQALNETENYDLDVLGISESRWTGAGKLTSRGHLILHSGHENQHYGGVAVILNKRIKKALIEWYPVNERIIVVKLNSKFAKMTIIQVYAPTNQAEEEEKDNFYDQLQTEVNKVKAHDVLVLCGDLNAKVGSQNEGIERNMGKHGLGEQNENGEKFVGFCVENNLTVGGTMFQHKNIHKATWTSPDKNTVNQIDHLAINNKWRSSLNDVRTQRGADINSDHFLVIAKIRLKLKKANHTTSEKPRKFDTSKLRRPEIKEEFKMELNNRFEILGNLAEDEDNVIEAKWTRIKKLYTETAEEVLGYQKKQDKEWIQKETFDKIDERKELKRKILDKKNIEERTRLEREYQEKDREVKRSARRDKRAFINQLAQSAEDAAKIGDSAKVYKITKKLCNKSFNSTKPIKSKNGSILTSDKEQEKRWMEHFKEVFNQPPPVEQIEIEENDEITEISAEKPSRNEIRTAVLSLKKNKAPGTDSVQAELIQADPEIAATVFGDLFDDIWEKEAIPQEWKKGMITKLPKKGDLGSCDNWRGITLLSIPSKIFCKIILKRIEEEIDSKLREEQAGFRRNRGCIDQILTLRNIIEQSIEWNEQININFIDFKKAFDSLNRSVIWKILKKYGVPVKLINLIKTLYEGYECCVILENRLSDWFSVETGVRQGCILSPILFLVTIDWVMRKTCNVPRGIRWNIFNYLEDLDFADDLALISNRVGQLQEKTERLEKFAGQTGLVINEMKTKSMHINNPSVEKLKVNGNEVESVDEFIYLGSVVSTDNSAEKDIKHRINKAKGSYAMLRPIWNSREYSRKTKIKIFKSNVLSVLLYGSETWRVTEKDLKKLETFQNTCLRRIYKIFWPNTVSNRALLRLSNTKSIEETMKERRLRLLGHVLRMGNNRAPKVAMRWTPSNGKRKRGRPRMTWRRTVEKDLKEIGLSWGEAEAAARDRGNWRQLVRPLAPTEEL